MVFMDWNDNGRDDFADDMMDFYIINESSENGDGTNGYGYNRTHRLIKDIFTWCTIGFFGILSLVIHGKGKRRGLGGIGLALLCGFFIMKGMGGIATSLTQCLGVAAAANVAGGLAVKNKIRERCSNAVDRVTSNSRGERTRSSEVSSGSSRESVGSNEETLVVNRENVERKENNIEEKTTIVSNYSNVSVSSNKKSKNDKENDEKQKIKSNKNVVTENDSIQDNKICTYKKEDDDKDKNTYKSTNEKEISMHTYEIKPLSEADMKKLQEEMEEESRNVEYYDTVAIAVKDMESTVEDISSTPDYKKIMIERIKGKGISECPAIVWTDKGNLCVYPLIKGGKIYRWKIADIEGIYFQKRINPDMDNEFYNVGISKIIDEYEELLPIYPFGEEGVYTWKYIVDEELEVTNSSGKALFEMIGEENIEVRSQIEMFKEMGMFR